MMEVDPALIQSSIQTLSHQLDAEKTRLAAFLNHQVPNVSHVLASAAHLQTSLASLGLSLSQIADHTDLTDTRNALLKVLKVAETALEVNSQKELFALRNPEERLGDLVRIFVTQKEKLRDFSLLQKDIYIVNATMVQVNDNEIRLNSYLSSLHKEMIQFTDSSISLKSSVSRGAETLRLREVYSYLKLMGTDESLIKDMNFQLFGLLRRLTENEKVIEEKGEKSISLRIVKEKVGIRVGDSLSYMSQFLLFTFSHVSAGDLEIFHKIETQMDISTLVLPMIKKELLHFRDDLEGKNRLLAAVKDFGETLKTVKASEGVLGSVQAIIEDAEAQMVKYNCELILERMRDLVISPDNRCRVVSDQTEKWTLSTKIGKKDTHEGVFLIPTMQVTESTHDLVAHLQDIMEDAVKASPRTALELILTVRHSIQLFKALRQYSQAASIESSPVTAALFHNDCLYLCHYLVLIPAELSSRLPADVVQSSFLLEFEPLLRYQANECLLSLLKRQESVLKATMENVETIKLDRNFEEMEELVLSTTAHISTVAGSLKDILCETDYLHFTGLLVNIVSSALLEKVFALGQIAKDDEAALEQLISHFLSLDRLFLRQNPASFVEVWEKLEIVKNVLESDMNGILKLYTEGKLTRALTTEEVTQLIEAMFEDSPKRRECLRIMTETPE